MPELKPEYPKRLNFIEMTLVKMLAEKHCWNDTVDIANALYEIRAHAKSMREEMKILSVDKDGANTKEDPAL